MGATADIGGTLEDEDGREALRIKVWRGGSASIASVRAGRY